MKNLYWRWSRALLVCILRQFLFSKPEYFFYFYKHMWKLKIYMNICNHTWAYILSYINMLYRIRSCIVQCITINDFIMIIYLWIQNLRQYFAIYDYINACVWFIYPHIGPYIVIYLKCWIRRYVYGSYEIMHGNIFQNEWSYVIMYDHIQAHVWLCTFIHIAILA